jgi:hypothetical protein
VGAIYFVDKAFKPSEKRGKKAQGMQCAAVMLHHSINRHFKLTRA